MENLIAAAIQAGEIVEDLHKRGDQRGDVGHGGSGQNLFGALAVGFRKSAVGRQGGEGAAGRVELDGERNELEERDQNEGGDAGDVELDDAQCEAEKDQIRRGPRTELTGRQNRRTQLDRPVADGVLHSVPRFVGGDADGTDRSRTVDAIGKADHVGARVIVVGEIAGDVLDLHRVESVGIEDRAGSLCAGHAAGVDHALVFFEARVDRILRPQRKQHGGQHEENVVVVKHEKYPFCALCNVLNRIIYTSPPKYKRKLIV